MLEEYDNFGNKLGGLKAEDSFASLNMAPPPGTIGDKVNDPVAPNAIISGGTASNLQVEGVVKSGKDANTAGMRKAEASSDIVFWAGAIEENRTTAPFRVNAAGDVNMTSATISDVAINTKGNFGGDGSDGALTIASGTTTIDLANAKVTTKNYTSISITGTGALAFSNPHASGSIIILKSQGAVTLTSSANPNITLVGMGAAGGAVSSTGTTAVPLTDTAAHGGLRGGLNTGGAIYANSGLYTIDAGKYRAFGLFLACGSGGGGGDGVGTGSAGGGALVIECAGALNCTGNISVAGATGSYGGGSGGSCVVFYNTATATSGTISDAGGAGGNAANGGAGGGGGIGGAGGDGAGNQSGGGAGGGGAGSGGTAGAASTSADHYVQI